jgi:hypothetical protein
MRNATVIAAVLALPVVAGGASEGAPGDRSGAAVSIFASYCLSALPDFSALDRRATAAGYHVFLNRSMPMGAGQSISQKNWLVPSPGGTILLTSEDATNGPLHVVGCGIVITDVPEEEMERMLAGDAGLGAPVKRVDGGANASSTVTWLAHFPPRAPGEDAQVMLAYNIPGVQGIAVNLIFRTHLDR